jgi:hypothetical protein
MRIACLGWGSLVWNSGALPVTGAWKLDGPGLPLEFARASRDGRMTLVIVLDGAICPTLWAEIDVPCLTDAVVALAAREECPSAAIGRWPVADTTFPHVDVIASWAERANLDGVVWTALQPGFRGRRGVVPGLAEIVAHLRALDRAGRDKAAEYIAKAPPQIATRFRPALAAELDLPVA